MSTDNELIDLTRLSGSKYTIMMPLGKKIIYSLCQNLPEDPDLPEKCKNRAGCLLDSSNHVLATFDLPDSGPTYDDKSSQAQFKIAIKFLSKIKIWSKNRVTSYF